MIQIIDKDYIAAMLRLPDGLERMEAWINRLIDERDVAQAIAASCVRDTQPLRKRCD
jgi:hypothetical protein